MSSPISVLHLDDDAQFLEMVSAFLRREDDEFAVETATATATALERLAAGDLDCIVSDYEMPEMTGIELLEKVRATDPALPFILFTGKGSEEVASEALTAGATDYLQKTAGTEQYKLLANRIRHAVQTYRSEAAVRRSEERYHNLVDTAPIPIMLFDDDRELIYANDAAVGFMDAESYAAIEGDPFTRFLHPDDRQTASNRFEKLMTEGADAPATEFRVRTVEGDIKRATVATAYGYYKDEKVAQAMIAP